jgi:hypothetical protein
LEAFEFGVKLREALDGLDVFETTSDRVRELKSRVSNLGDGELAAVRNQLMGHYDREHVWRKIMVVRFRPYSRTKMYLEWQKYGWSQRT